MLCEKIRELACARQVIREIGIERCVRPSPVEPRGAVASNDLTVTAVTASASDTWKDGSNETEEPAMQTNVTRTVVRLMPNPMATTLRSRKVAVTLPFVRGLDDRADEDAPPARRNESQ